MPKVVPTPKKGFARLVAAFKNSMAGFHEVWHEAAFRQECIAAVVLIPASFWIGQTWLETAFLSALVIFVLVTEILNSAIEAVVDRFGPEWNQYAKAAKDMGSAAVLLALVLCSITWCYAIYARFFVSLSSF